MTTLYEPGMDRELLSVLVALEPLDDRKWRYFDLTRRTFDAEGMLAQPWSSGERVLIEVAASLWNDGKVDLGYVACAMGGRQFQAVVDALAVRGDHEVTSDVGAAIARAAGNMRPGSVSPTNRRHRNGSLPGEDARTLDPGSRRGLER